MKRKAIFLDRDGTLNVEKNYVYQINDFEWIQNSEEAIRRFKECGYMVIVISNQAGIARGFYSIQDVEKLHRYVNSHLARFNTSIDDFFICPHHPLGKVNEYTKDCSCRKPKPGLILQAAEKYDIDLAKSIMIGDKESDVLAGISAGVGKTILVRSGHPIMDETQATDIENSIFDVSLHMINVNT